MTSFVFICQIKIKSTPRSIEQNGICQWCVRHARWRNVGQKIEIQLWGVSLKGVLLSVCTRYFSLLAVTKCLTKAS